MAAKKMYAWSRIFTGKKTIKIGSEVTKTDVGDDWDALVEAGSIRPHKYPENVKTYESPRNAILREANERVAAVLEPYQAEEDDDEDNEEETSKTSL